MPVEKAEDGGPRSVKCQSKRSASEAGAAWKSGEGELASSWASRRIRFMVGDLELNLGVAIIVQRW